jgi:outer membrane protein insertion porin family
VIIVRNITIICFILICISTLKAEYLDSIIKVDSNINRKFKVGSIIISGNERTKDFVILREMRTREKDSTDLETLKEDYQNIVNLGLFNKVDLLPIPDISGKEINLLIDVEETFYIIPMPQGGFKDGSLKKFWGGVKLLWRNFRGRNETLQTSFGLGYEPFISVGYFNPWIGEKSRFFIGGNFSFNKSINKDFDEDGNQYILKDEAEDYKVLSYSGNLMIGKYLSKYLSLSLDYAYNYIYVPDVKDGRSFSSDGRDIYSRISFNTIYEKRDNVVYTTHGTSFFAQYSKFGIFNNDIDYSRVEVSLKKFIPVRIKGDYFISYAFWLRGVSNFGGTVPQYKLEVYGYDVYVRGWKDYIVEGENSIGYFSEVRIPVIKPFFVKGKDHFIIKKIPVFNNLSYQYGLYTTLFFDIAGVFYRNQMLKDVKFQNGYGIGLNVILPFNFVARVDVAFNKEIKEFTSRFSLDLEAYF